VRRPTVGLEHEVEPDIQAGTEADHTLGQGRCAIAAPADSVPEVGTATGESTEDDTAAGAATEPRNPCTLGLLDATDELAHQQERLTSMVREPEEPD
jgi:hypothetical protein